MISYCMYLTLRVWQILLDAYVLKTDQVCNQTESLKGRFFSKTFNCAENSH